MLFYIIYLSDEKSAYEKFCDCLENELKKCAGSPLAFQAKTRPMTILEHATLSIAHKLYAEVGIR